jgi:hypothetical protein
MAPHDWMLLIQLFALLGLVTAGQGPTRRQAIGLLTLDIVWFGLALVWARGRTAERTTRLSSAFYRLSLIAVTVASYVELRWVLPIVAPGSVDADLLAFDLRVFHVEPALAWDHLVTPRTTEWFAFFYYSYFFILALYAIPIALAFEDGPALHEFAFGIILLFCVGHLTYVLVPAVGPHLHVREFERGLDGGVFWKLVKAAVDGAGAGKDVFPSLHTAGPLFLTLYAFRHRARQPFREAWPITAIFASQIVIATMFLRWHYLADIVAGGCLALTAWILAPRIASWDERRRRRTGLAPEFPPSPLRAEVKRALPPRSRALPPRGLR